jgi:hypothetical protein
MDVLFILLYLVAAAVGFTIWYFIIKVAVRNGIIEAKRDLLAVENRKAEQAAAPTTAAGYKVKPGDEIW